MSYITYSVALNFTTFFKLTRCYALNVHRPMLIAIKVAVKLNLVDFVPKRLPPCRTVNYWNPKKTVLPKKPVFLVSDVIRVTKFCFPSFGGEPGCRTIKINHSPFGRFPTVQCFCNGSDFCNMGISNTQVNLYLYFSLLIAVLISFCFCTSWIKAKATAVVLIQINLQVMLDSEVASCKD